MLFRVPRSSSRLDGVFDFRNEPSRRHDSQPFPPPRCPLRFDFDHPNVPCRINEILKMPRGDSRI
jgi:hypothetical protein